MSDTPKPKQETTKTAAPARSSNLITDINDKKQIAEFRRKMQARALVDHIFKIEPGTPERWKAIRNLWWGVYPDAKLAHYECVIVAAEKKARQIDPKFGRTRAALGIAYEDPKINGNTRMRHVAYMPEDLKYLLKRFDPQVLGMLRGEEGRKYWLRVYATFPEYRTTEQL